MNTRPPLTKEEQARQQRGHAMYLGLVPVLLSLLLVIGLWRFPPAFGVYEPHFLLPIFNTILFLASGVIAYIAWRSYLLSGLATILWMGCGVLALGTGALTAGWLIYPFGSNVNVTIFNVAVLLAAICHTGGVTASLDGEARKIDPKNRPLRVTTAYLAVLAVIALLVGLTLGGIMPPFFIQGQGPTVLRQYVVEWSVVLLTFASLVLMMRFSRLRSAFLYWYSLALALVAIAMLAFFLQKAVGSLIGWVGRSSYVLAAIYFLVSVSTAWRQARSTGVGLNEAMADLFGPEQSRALFDNLNESLVINELLFDEKGKPCDWRILNVNPAYLKTTGKSPDEVIGRRLSEIYNIDRAPEPFLSLFAQVVETGKPVQVEGFFEPLRKYLRISAFHLGGSRFATLVTDITERQQAEEALRESEARLDLALRSSEMGVWNFDLVENKRFFDDQVCHLLGLDPAEFTGKAEEFFNAVHPQDRAAVKTLLARSIEHGVPYESEYRTIWPDDSIHHVTARGKLAYDDEGRPVRIHGLIWDITEPKRAEEALRQARDELEQRVQERTLDLRLANEVLLRTINEREIAQGRLRESEARFAAFMEYLPGLAVMRDMEGNYLFANRAWEETMHLEPGAWQSRTLSQLWSPEQTANLQKLDFEIIASGKPTEQVELVELPDGPHHYLSKHFPILDENGLPYMVGNIAIDITQRRRAEQELQESEARLRYLAAQLLEIQEQERKRLSMDLHDDLGQSLLVLRMQLNAILRGSSPEPPVRQGIEEASSYLRQVIDKVRTLSHSLSPTMLESMGLTNALRSLLDEFQRYHELNIETDLDEVGGLLPKESHIGMYRIIQEFLANVHKHAEANKVKVAIKAGPDQVTIALEDDGKGFSLAELQDNLQKQRGLGLLSMEERARSMGGTFHLWSQPKSGTKLYITVPLKGEYLPAAT